MANHKFDTVEKEICGKKYVAQFNGLSAALKGIDQCYIDGTENLSAYKIGEYVLKNVIVDPTGVEIDDFESMEEYNEVIRWGQEVMNGKFRPASEQDEGKGKGKK